jgi:protein TonB
VWELFYRWRTRIALSVTGLILVMVVIAAVVWVRPQDPPTLPGPDMTIALTAPQPAPPEPAPEEPPPPPEVKPDQFIDKQVKHRERQDKPVPPSNIPSTPDAAPSDDPPGPPAKPPGRPAKDLEEAYAATVHQHLESIKRYPTDKDARVQQPKGTVTVRYVVARDGTLVSAVIEVSAGSILDRAALATIRRAHFPPFPAELWPGEATHEFRSELEFNTAS